MLQPRDVITIDNNWVHAIPQGYDNVTETPNKQGPKRPWVRWERDLPLITHHLDWYQNTREDWVIAVEDYASRKILGMTETDRRSSAEPIELLDEVGEEYAGTGEILEVITDHRTEFYANKRDKHGEADHRFQTYHAENRIKQTLCAVGRPQSNGKIERFFQTYDKQRWRFDSLDEFVDYYNFQRLHQSLRYDELETPAEAFFRLLPTAEDVAELAVTDGGEHGTK